MSETLIDFRVGTRSMSPEDPMDTKDAANCVAVFAGHPQAEAAIRQLPSSGFDMKNSRSSGATTTPKSMPSAFNAGDRVKYRGKLGSFWGMAFGIFFAPAFFFIPGIGPILTAGIISSILVGTLAGAAVGAAIGGGTSALVAALKSGGIPKDSVIRYERDLKADKCLLIATGTAAEVESARAILAAQGGQIDVHNS